MLFTWPPFKSTYLRLEVKKVLLTMIIEIHECDFVGWWFFYESMVEIYHETRLVLRGLVAWFIGIALFKLFVGSISSLPLQDKYSDKINKQNLFKEGPFLTQRWIFQWNLPLGFLMQLGILVLIIKTLLENGIEHMLNPEARKMDGGYKIHCWKVLDVETL